MKDILLRIMQSSCPVCAHRVAANPGINLMTDVKDKHMGRIKATLTWFDFIEFQTVAIIMNESEQSLLAATLLNVTFSQLFAISSTFDRAMRSKRIPEATVSTRLFLWIGIGNKLFIHSRAFLPLIYSYDTATYRR